ncbi:MAG TPA: signal peptide peptidase SppA [Xanthobacteraceae bacterium]|jgi:protease IV|nr:signal peptide peptidase SppA [Xanthobacteraceae bacterium]
MSLETDHIVDRRRLRRKLTYWRVATVLIAIIGVVGVAVAVRRSDSSLTQSLTPQISRVTIQGIIRGDHERTEALDNLARSRNTRAVIVHIDSPGGTTAGSEELHQALRRVAAQKPTVVVIDGMAASGGYMAAMAADHIIAQNSSLVGSIGVLFQYPNLTDLLTKVGVKVEEIKSSPLKAAPNGLEPTTPEARAAIEALVVDSYGWFKDIVKDRRKLEGEALDRVADGRVFTGRQAISLSLADEIGREQEAIDWLAKSSNIDPKTPVRDWRLYPRFSQLSLLHLGVAKILETWGFGALTRDLETSGALQAAEKLNLDGLLMLWHPPAGN